jgi:hypothetical protein
VFGVNSARSLYLLMLSATLAQAQSATDSALVGRILLAEDRRDSTDAALTEGASHADARIRTLALRARARIRDPRFTARDSFPPVAAPKVWPEPAWRLRFRALAGQPTCDALRAATADVSWPVRIRAADRIADARVTSCVADDSLAAAFTRWVDALPATIGRRAPGNVTWHAAAHGIVALARLDPDAAKARMAKVATHRQWQVRMYAARAARALSDTATLRALVADRDANVAEVAIEGLSSLTGHADDELFLTVLTHPGAQAVRAAAIALKGSPLRTVPAAANATFDRWVQRQNA